MGNILGSILYLYGISLIISMICALFRFLADVKKWHDKEEPVHITPSEFEADLLAAEAETQGEEVNVDDSESREHNSPLVF